MVRRPRLNCSQSAFLASSLSVVYPIESVSSLSLLNNRISFGARVQRFLCMQAKFPPPNTSIKYSSPAILRALMASLLILYGPWSKSSSWMTLTKGLQGMMGSTSVWSFFISLSADRAFGFLGFLWATSPLGC